jgi:hypothetical protein
MNFYFNPKWRDDSWWHPSFIVYSVLSGVATSLVVLGFAKFAKKFL